MRICTIRITDKKEINIEPGGMSPAEIVTALDAVQNVLCEQATGDYQKGQQMKKFCADQNLKSGNNIILPPTMPH
jgi:hypothetical protein